MKFLFEEFWKICKKIQIRLKYNKNNGYSTGAHTIMMTVPELF